LCSRGGEIGREGHEGAVAGEARADAVPVEPIGQAVVVDGLSGNSAGEQPSRSVCSVVDHEPGGWSIGQLSDDRTEAGRQKDRMLAGSQISVVILCHNMFRAKVTDPLGLKPEQKNERACRADVDGHRLVVEAALQ
jgi:hypothetical protein